MGRFRRFARATPGLARRPRQPLRVNLADRERAAQLTVRLVLLRRLTAQNGHPHRYAGIVRSVPDPHVHAQLRAEGAVGEAEAVAIAELMQALAAPSRVRLLYALRDGEAGVGELADRAGVTPSAASQQLRILRHLRFVATRRDGRAVLYRLHDGHVAALLDEVRNHLDHATLGWTAPAAQEAKKT